MLTFIESFAKIEFKLLPIPGIKSKTTNKTNLLSPPENLRTKSLVNFIYILVVYTWINKVTVAALYQSS